jgi:putative MATE family efflux protein
MSNDVLAKHFQRDEASISNLEITKTVLILSAPAVFEMLLVTLVGFADTAMVGRLADGGAGVAAVSLANNIFMFALTVFAAIGTGSTALVARSIGAGDHETANNVVVQSLISGGLLAVLVTAVGVFLPQQALDLMGAQGKANEYGVDYLRIVSYGAIPVFVMQLLTGCLRGAGDTRTPMLINGGVNLLNIFLNYVLIYGHFGAPALGVAGAAIATSISRTAGTLVLFLLFAFKRLKLSFGSIKSVSLNMPLTQRIMNVGIPAAVEMGFMRGAQLLFARLVASLGTTAVAAHQIALNSESISFQPGWGIGMAGAAMVAQSLGAGKPKLAERFGYRALQLAVAIMGALGVVLYVVPQAFARFFIVDEEVVQLSAVCLKIVAISQPALACAMVMSNTLRTVGDTRRMLYITLGGFWLIRLPIGFVLVKYTGLGLAGAWIGMIADLFFRGAANLWLFSKGHWKAIRV